MIDVKTLSDNAEELKAIIANLQTKYEEELKQERFKFLVLEEKFKVLQRRFFGRKSEKISDTELGQLFLFNEAEVGSITEPPEKDEGIEA